MRATAAILLWVLAIGGLLAGCRAHMTAAPYGDEPPDTELLLAATAARLHTIQIPRAKIHEARRAGAGLELVAQAPASFAGRIHVGGHEILQLAVNPQSYALRLVESRGSALASGFYTGPPSSCAVETLVGVSMSPVQLTSLLLGGGPVIDGPRQVVERHWDRRRTRELVLVRNDLHDEQLEFAWVAGGWWFAGATVWIREGDRRRWLWTIRHEQLSRHGAVVLPARTTLRQPAPAQRRRRSRAGRDELVVVIEYGEPIVDPILAGPASEDSWTDDWEDEDAAAADTSSPAQAPAPAAAVPEVDPEDRLTTATQVPPTAEIAPAFRLDAVGLVPRGDLCRHP